MRKFDDGDSLRPEEQKQRNDPQPNGDSAIGGDARNHIQIEDRHHKQQHEIPAAENAFQVGLLVVGVEIDLLQDKLVRVRNQVFASVRAQRPGTTRMSSALLLHLHALLLRLCECGCDIVERGEVLVDVGFGVLNGNRPLLVPPVRLRHHAAIDHAEPVVPPQIDVDGQPVAVVANLLRVEHESAIRPCARDVCLQADFRDDLAYPSVSFLLSFSTCA